MKAQLKKICITKDKIKESVKEEWRYKDIMERLERYVDSVRGVFVKNDISFKEDDSCIELSEPKEIDIPKPSGIIADFIIYVYILRFEDPLEKDELKKNIISVSKDGTVGIRYEHHLIYLPQGWYEKDEVEATVKTDGYGSYSMIKDVVEGLERSIDNADKVYTIRLPQWLIKKLRNMDTNMIRDTLTKLVEGYTMVSRYELDSLKSNLESAKRKLSDTENELKELRDKYNMLVEFIKEKGLSEEFREFVKKESEKQNEKEIEERFSEIFEEE